MKRMRCCLRCSLRASGREVERGVCTLRQAHPAAAALYLSPPRLHAYSVAPAFTVEMASAMVVEVAQTPQVPFDPSWRRVRVVSATGVCA